MDLMTYSSLAGMTMFLAVVGFTILVGIGLMQMFGRIKPAAPADDEIREAVERIVEAIPEGDYVTAIGDSALFPGKFNFSMVLNRPLEHDEVLDFMFQTFIEEDQDPSDVDAFLNQIQADNYDSRILNYLFALEMGDGDDSEDDRE